MVEDPKVGAILTDRGGVGVRVMVATTRTSLCL